MADTNVKILADREDIVAIADAVRSKTGTSGEMTLGGIASGINGITGGTEDLNSELTTQESLIAELSTILDAKASGGGEQATPVISVNSTNGLITATAGTKTSTHQLAFQVAKTITPGTTNQTAVSSGYYTGGAVTVKGDSNLVAGNIKSGVSIFGVNGNYIGSGGDTSVEDGLLAGTLTSYANDRISTIKDYTFYNCTKLATIDFPAVTVISSYAFYNCFSLTTAIFPKATTIGGSAFCNCSSLATISFPKATTIGSSAFCNCSSLATISFPAVTFINSYAFYNCSRLTIASFPKVTSIYPYAFCGCKNLTTISFPVATIIENRTFDYCSNLTTASFPKVISIYSSAFYNCHSLTTASFPAATRIGSSAFYCCYNLKSLYLTGSSLCQLSNSNAFKSTPIGGYSTSAGTYGSIFVPTSLLASYQATTNWAYFSKRFVGI